MTDDQRPSGEVAEYALAPGTVTVRVKVRCGCGVRSQALQMVADALPHLRRANVDPGLVVASVWCKDCKTYAKVHARDLHLTNP